MDARRGRIDTELYDPIIKAVLDQALHDACSDNLELAAEARFWLSQEGPLYCMALGFDERAVMHWLASGCPKAAGDE